METYTANFHTSFFIPEIHKLVFTSHTYVSWVLITVATLTVNNSNVIDQINICCVVAIMLREWQLVFHTKYSLNNMAAIDICLFKSLNWRNLVHKHILKQQQQQHKLSHVIMCFTLFSLMTSNKILPQLLHTAKSSLYC